MVRHKNRGHTERRSMLKCVHKKVCKWWILRIFGGADKQQEHVSKVGGSEGDCGLGSITGDIF